MEDPPGVRLERRLSEPLLVRPGAPGPLQGPVLLVGDSRRVELIWDLHDLTYATRSLVTRPRSTAARIVTREGREYLLDGEARIVGLAKGSLFDRLMTLFDPMVRVERTLRPTGQAPSLDDLKRRVRGDAMLLHNVEAGDGRMRAFRRRIERAGSVEALVDVLASYFPPARPSARP